MEKRAGSWLLFVSLLIVSVLPADRVGLAQDKAKVIVPATSIERPEDFGKRAHTNHLIVVPSSATPMSVTPRGVTPAIIRSAYNLPTSPSPGKGGGSGVIAVVDAFDYPTAQSDFDTFATQYGLPLSTDNVCNGANPCFRKVFAQGKPRMNCAWSQEMALDIEWAHAMAPFAQIVLVEAKSASFTDLFKAVDVATQTVINGGGGEVSMSWGASEFLGETFYDSHFTANSGVVYLAASGDTGGQTIYPSSSPFVVATGGTTLNFSGTTFQSETAWSGSGGGPSIYETRPAYQTSISTLVGNARGVPDISFDSDPISGVSGFDSTSCNGLVGWLIFAGTSVASPSLAGIVNAAGHFSSNSTNELITIYSNMSNSSDFRDITSGTAGTFTALKGWDFITGAGSSLGLAGK